MPAFTRAFVFGVLAPMVCYGGCCCNIKKAVAPLESEDENADGEIELTTLRTRDGNLANIWQVGYENTWLLIE